MSAQNSFKYPEWAKMPENYDFSTRSEINRKRLD